MSDRPSPETIAGDDRQPGNPQPGTRQPGARQSEIDEVHSRVRAIVDGDRSAAAWLFDTFADDLFRRLRHRYGYPGGLDADDLLQDAFVFYFQRQAKVLADFLQRTPRRGQTRKALMRHLWNLACGLASNRRRSAALRTVVPIDELRTRSTSADAERQAIDRDAVEQLDECLSEGRERVYLYYKLRYRDGLTPQQISSATGWSMKATYKLKQALNGAVEHCAELLGLEMNARRGAGATLVAALLVASCRTPPPPVLDLPAVVRGHAEVRIDTADRALPLVFERAPRLGLCLEVPPTTDTSRWEARLSLDGRRAAEGFEPAAARMGSTLCFDAELELGADVAREREAELCGELVDRFDDRVFRLPCRSVALRPDAKTYARRVAELERLLAAPPESLEALLAELERLGGRARDAELPLLAVRAELIAVHFLTLQGGEEAIAEARRRLDALPGWLDRPATSARGAQAAYQQALFALDAEQQLGDAWTLLRRAERRYRRIADPNRFLVTVQQAAILSRVGARSEAVEQLREAIADCATMPCDDELLAHARGELAWLILLDPYALGPELAEAERSLGAGLEVLDAESYPLEVANQLVNLAYLRVRQALSPEQALRRAEALLGGENPSWDGVDRLRDWATLVRGLDALAGRRLERASELRAALTERDDPELSAWALSCQGRAERRQGRLARAAASFERALLRHELGRAEEIGQQLPLGPGRRAEDFAEAARLAVERGSPERAWELLARLDLLAVDASERRRCREQAKTPEIRRRWADIDSRSRRLRAQLLDLDSPAAGRRREQAESIRRQLQATLRELWREMPGCERAPGQGDAGVDFRAVALDDEVLLLRRDGERRVVLEKRTAIARRELVLLTRAVDRALDRRQLDDEAWDRSVEPLARALLPNARRRLPEVSTFALHGLLQTVPLAALPVPDRALEDGTGDAGEDAIDDAGAARPRRLADLTTVALRSAGASARELPRGSQPPLFIVDPRGDLAGAAELADTYRRLFPRARMLAGAEATAAAFRSQLPAEWLHVDAHGIYDPGFPELSAIELADRPLGLVELAELPAAFRFANLSGCQTGRWPTTADSGRYGIAGLLSRLGAPWVIGSRADLEDEVAAALNRAFYRELSVGGSVPFAYRRALAEVRSRFAATRWAAILLLSGGAEPGEGQRSLAATPFRVEVDGT